jgi:hypothetical protein
VLELGGRKSHVSGHSTVRRPDRAMYGVAMPDVTITLGAAVVKAACKLWARDSPFSQDVEAAFIDLIAERVSGWREQRQIKREFDQLEERVADRLLNYLAHEFSSLAENEKNAAIMAVKDTFDRARLTDRALFQQDLDPLYLERFLRKAVLGATRDLGEAATGLYDRLLPECCAYVIAISTTLPRFSANAFTEILRRQSYIIDVVDQMLARLPRQEESVEPVGSPFTTAYRRHVATKWDRMRLFGTDASTQNYPLSVAYISLNVTRESSGMAKSASGTEIGVQRVDAALRDTRRVFLRGEPGSGKTTLLHWFAVRAARDDFPDQLRSWNGVIPFFIPLREYAEKELPDPPAFLRHAGIHLSTTAPAGWVERILSEGHALLLIDGVDELPKERRESARIWLRNLISDFRECRYVVTTRSAATVPDWLAAEGFDTAVLEPLTPHDIEVFVRHWYEAVTSETAEADERRALAKSQQYLISTILSTRHLLNLAGTPLLCALLCALYRDRHAVLPRDRVELYEAALAMLLERRDVERGIEASRIDLSRREKTFLLQELAYWLITNGLTEAAEERVIKQVGRTIVGLRHVTEPAADVFRYLLERSGLLHETAAGWVGFIHRTFEEYLAAKAFVDNDQLDMLVKNAENDQWREVVVMAAGHAPNRQREKLVRELLMRADHLGRPRGVFSMSFPNDAAQRTITITAFACLENMPSAPSRLIESLRKHSSQIIPPKSMDEAATLASAGEFGLMLLKEHGADSAAEISRLIRTASLVGGREALDLIQRTVRSADTKLSDNLLVQDAIISAWLRFDPELYARRVISGTLFARSIRVRNPELAAGIHHIRGLESLQLEQECGLDNVGALPDLKRLAVEKIPDISLVSQYQSLTELRLDGVMNPDLRPLSALTQLEVLAIGFAATPRINFDAAPLRGMLQLRRLEISGVRDCDVTALDEIRPTVEIHASGVEIKGW